MKQLWVVIAILAMASPVFANDVMKFAFGNDAPPFAWEEDGQIYGLLPDIAREVVEKGVGINVSVHLHPWKRAQHLVRLGVLDAHITNGPLRKEWAEYSSEAVVVLKHVLYVKAGGSKFNELKKVRTIEDLKPFKLVDHRGSAWAQKNLIEKGIDVHLVADFDTMYRMVAKGRVDAVAYEPLMARYQIKNLGLQDQLVELPLKTDELPFHVVIRKKSPFVKMLPKIDEVIRQMKQDGTLQAILDKYR